MIVDVEGVRYEVPDDATPDEIGTIAGAPPGVTRGESAARGAVQGLTLGWGDEAAAGIAAALPFLDREAAQGQTLGQRFLRAREFYRGRNRKAEAANPGTYIAGQLAGGIAPLAVVGVPAGAGRAVAAAAGQGAAAGAGYSEAQNAGGLARDTAIGGSLGAGAYGLGELGGTALRGIAARAGRGVAAAEAKAAKMAAEKVEKEVASLRGAYGGARQNESRAIEVLLRAEATGALTPQQAAQLAALKAAPEWQATIQNVAQNYMDDFGGLAGASTGAKSAYQQAAQSVPAATAAEKAAILSGKEARDQVAARVKRYGPPVVGSAIGTAVGGPVGTAIGALAGAGTRPAVHAVRRMAQHPAVQKRVLSSVEKAARAPIRRPGAGRAARAAATQRALVEALESQKKDDLAELLLAADE